MTPKTYSNSFWGEELTSTEGFEALVKRNKESKKICAEFEDYLKKRSKVEADYSKSLAELSRCFKEKTELGVLEATYNKLRRELENRSNHHSESAASFQQRAELVKKFKEDQTSKRKAQEESVNKAQRNKLSQYSKTKQLEKTYVNKHRERDTADRHYKDISSSQTIPPKEVEKARTKAAKAEDEASKSHSAYHSAVLVLNDNRIEWEREMFKACEVIQKLDEERLTFLREEIWWSVNEDSRLALETDLSCEQVREILEKCDIASDIQAFIHASTTGDEHPDEYTFRHYQSFSSDRDSDSTNSDPFNAYSLADELDDNGHSGTSAAASTPTVKRLNLPKILKKTKPSS